MPFSLPPSARANLYHAVHRSSSTAISWMLSCVHSYLFILSQIVLLRWLISWSFSLCMNILNYRIVLFRGCMYVETILVLGLRTENIHLSGYTNFEDSQHAFHVSYAHSLVVSWTRAINKFTDMSDDDSRWKTPSCLRVDGRGTVFVVRK